MKTLIACPEPPESPRSEITYFDGCDVTLTGTSGASYAWTIGGGGWS